MLEFSTIDNMIRTPDGLGESQTMAETTLNLRGLKCPLPALRTRKALAAMAAGDILIVECTDPLAGVDIPNLLNQTGDALEETRKEKKLLTFRIRKR
jgi:tRNA 2-thiouridine synthesizing protein A